jgi:hypothetical protein
MRRALVLLAIAALFAFAGAEAGRAELVPAGTVRLHLDGGFLPHALPRDRPAPLSVWVKGRVTTSDGSHPPPLRRLEIALNRHGRLDSRGLPTCSPARLQSTSTSAALDRCRDALVGHGHFHAAFTFGTTPAIPSDGTILAFNGRQSGHPVLLMHLFGTVPVHATFVLSVKISHSREGDFGTILRTKIPKLAGLGAITTIDLRIGRRYSFRGERHSYLSASCAAPPGFHSAYFPFLRGGFSFEGHSTVRATLLRGCQVR